MPHLVFRSETVDLPGYSLGGGAVTGYSYVCATCGKLWATLELGGTCGYIISAWPCDLHGTPQTRGGSLLHRLRWGNYTEHDSWKTVEALPYGLLRHESLMLANQLLKGSL